MTTLVEVTWPAIGRRHGDDKEAEKRRGETDQRSIKKTVNHDPMSVVYQPETSGRWRVVMDGGWPEGGWVGLGVGTILFIYSAAFGDHWVHCLMATWWWYRRFNRRINASSFRVTAASDLRRCRDSHMKRNGCCDVHTETGNGCNYKSHRRDLST